MTAYKTSCVECGAIEVNRDVSICVVCGAKLGESAIGDRAPTPQPTSASSTESPARFVGFVFGVVAIVVALVWLGSYTTKEGQSKVMVSAFPETIPNPLPPAADMRASVLQAEIASLNPAERQAKQRELVSLYVGVKRFDHASIVQKAIADATGQAADWRLAGDYFYGWMRYAQSAGGPVSEISAHAIDSYLMVLQLEPDNLDVRTDLATAYLGSSQPMLAVQEIKAVLAADSTHLEARFNYGVMLAQIGRIDDAISEFETVKSRAAEDSDHYVQAEAAIAVVRQ